MGKRFSIVIAALLALGLGRAVSAQQDPQPAKLPDNPVAKQDPNQTNQKEAEKSVLQSSLGLIAKRSWFYPELARTPGKLRAEQKFKLFLDKSLSPPQILGSTAGAAIGQARDTFPGYGQGADGFGKRFGASMASGASSHFFGTFLLPAILRDDPRFFVKLNGGFGARVGYALRRTLVIRTDVGTETFNVPGTLGPLAAEGLANTYLPDSERTVGKTFQRCALRIGFSAANNVVKEYWPSIFKKLRLDKVAPGLEPER